MNFGMAEKPRKADAIASYCALCTLNRCTDHMKQYQGWFCHLSCLYQVLQQGHGALKDTHWLRNAKRYLITIRVVFGRFRSTFRMWSALSCKLSIAERRKSTSESSHHIPTTCHWVPMQPVNCDGSCANYSEGQPAEQQQEEGRVCPFPESSGAAQHGNAKAAEPAGEAFWQWRSLNTWNFTASSFLAWEQWMSSVSIVLAQ